MSGTGDHSGWVKRMWDGVERRRHERYTVTVRIPRDIGEYLDGALGEDEHPTPPTPWQTAGTSIPYRQRRHGGDGTDQRIQRKGAGEEETT